MKADIVIPIYGSTITLIYDEHFENHIPGYDPEEFIHDVGVTIFYLDSNHYLIGIRPSEFGQTVISHEVTHLTHRIMECTGIEHSLLKDEAEAYLNGYIASKVVSEIYKHEEDSFIENHRFMKNFTL